MVDPIVVQAMIDQLSLGPSNPSSQHALGRAASERLDEAVVSIGRHLKSDFTQPGGPRLILTSGGTEANNLALAGLGYEADTPLVVSSIEHASVLEVAKHHAKQGREVHFLPVSGQGTVKVDALEDVLGKINRRQTLVSVMSANNETGVIQPTLQLAEICQRYGAMFHVDATQSFGKTEFVVADLPLAAVTITPHKFHGPPGIGALWIGSDVPLRAQLFGGAQQLMARPGTEPVALVIGMAKALELAVDNLSINSQQMVSLRDRFEAGLKQISDDLVIFGTNQDRLPSTTSVSFPATDRQSMLMALDIAGVACSSGAACSSGSSPPSHVLRAMGCKPSLIQSAIRFANSRFSTAEDIDRSIDRICSVYNRLRSV